MVFYPFARFWHNVERRRLLDLYADAKTILYSKGYTYQVSFYGTLTKPYDGVHTSARIEVMKRHEFWPGEIQGWLKYLSTYQPERETTLLVDTNKGVKQIICR